MIAIQNKKKHEWAYFLFVLFALSLFYPYEFVSVYLPFLPLKEYLTAAIVFVVVCFAFSVLDHKLKIEANKFIIVQVLGFTVIEILHGKFLTIFDYALRMMLAGLLVGFISQTIGLTSFFKKYNRWITIMAILGAVAFFLVTFANYSPLYVVEDRADGRYIFNYILTFTKSDTFIGNSFRYAGFFDEPGAMAYWGLFALLFNKLFIQDKYIEVVLIACLLLTFSMGFYVQLALYFIFFVVSKKNVSRTFKSLIVVLIIGFFVYSTRESYDHSFYQTSFGRFEELLDESMSADASEGVGNRAANQEKAYREFIKNPVIGTAEADSLNLGDNIFEPLAKYGIVGSLLVYSPLFYLLTYSVKRKKTDLLKVIIIIVVGFFHRPLHMNVLSFFITYSFLLFTIQQTRTKKEIAND